MKIRIDNKFTSRVLVLMTVLAAYYYILPSASIFVNYALALMGVFVMIAIFTVLFDNNRIPKILVWFLFLIVFISLLYLLLTDTKSIDINVSNYGIKRFTSKLYQMIMMFFPVYLYGHVRKNCSIKEKKTILIVTLGFVLFVIFQTIREVAINPNITRIWLSLVESGQKNVAGYYFTFAMPFIIVLCASYFQQTKKIFVKVIMLAVSAFLLYFLLIAQYTLSILLAFIGVGIAIILNTTNRFRTLVILGVMVIILVVPIIIKAVIPHIESQQIASRLNELYLFLTAGDMSTNNLGGRMELYQKSILAFLRSPIWGNRYLDFDGHATFLTILSDLGLLGAIPYFYLYHRSKKIIDGYVGKEKFLPVYIVLVAGGLLNPINSALPLMFVVWFVAPLSIELIAHMEDPDEKVGN